MPNEDEETAYLIPREETSERSVEERVNIQLDRVAESVRRGLTLLIKRREHWDCSRVREIARELRDLEATSFQLYEDNVEIRATQAQLHQLEAALKACVEALDPCLEILEWHKAYEKLDGCCQLIPSDGDGQDLEQAMYDLEQILLSIRARPAMQNYQDALELLELANVRKSRIFEECLSGRYSSHGASSGLCADLSQTSETAVDWPTAMPQGDGYTRSSRTSMSDQCTAMDKASAIRWLPTKTHSCYYIILLAVLVTIASTAFGISWAIRKRAIGDGFTISSYILAVGALILVPWTACHYNRCTCWRRQLQGSKGPFEGDIALDDR